MLIYSNVSNAVQQKHHCNRFTMSNDPKWSMWILCFRSEHVINVTKMLSKFLTLGTGHNSKSTELWLGMTGLKKKIFRETSLHLCSLACELSTTSLIRVHIAHSGFVSLLLVTRF